MTPSILDAASLVSAITPRMHQNGAECLLVVLWLRDGASIPQSTLTTPSVLLSVRGNPPGIPACVNEPTLPLSVRLVGRLHD